MLFFYFFIIKACDVIVYDIKLWAPRLARHKKCKSLHHCTGLHTIFFTRISHTCSVDKHISVGAKKYMLHYYYYFIWIDNTSVQLSREYVSSTNLVIVSSSLWRVTFFLWRFDKRYYAEGCSSFVDMLEWFVWRISVEHRVSNSTAYKNIGLIYCPPLYDWSALKNWRERKRKLAHSQLRIKALFKLRFTKVSILSALLSIDTWPFIKLLQIDNICIRCILCIY